MNPKMGATAERIHGTAGRIGTLGLELPEWRLPVGGMGVDALREYVDFRCALERCKASAQDEFTWIRRRIADVRALGDAVSRMTFPRFQSGRGGFVPEEQERQRQIHAAVQRQFMEFKKEFGDKFKRLEDCLERTARESADFKMVLFGRTQVGKSTIREALTCGDGETIGKGSSSTTKECHEYTWRNLHVWDTPGIDSRKDRNIDERGVGDEERAALEKLETADLAVFICKTDSLEVKERAMLRKIVESGRPYLILMNVVADITDYGKFKKRRKDRQITREAHREFIDDLLAPFPEAEAQLIPVHARACFFSRANGAAEVDEFFAKWKVGRQEVYGLSNFGEFRARLTAFICGEGEAARRKTIDRVFADKTEAFFDRQKKNIQKHIDELHGVRKELEKGREALDRIRARWTGCALKGKAATELRRELDTADIAEECIEKKYDKERIRNFWEQELGHAVSTAQKSLEQTFHHDLGRTMGDLQAALRFNAAAFSRISEVDDHAIDGRKAMKNGAKAAGIGGAALLAVANWWNPGGWVVGIGAALAGIGTLLGWLAGLFQSKKTKINKLRAQFDEDVSATAANVGEWAERAVEGALSAVDEGLLRGVKDNVDMEDRLRHVSDVCRRAEDIVKTARKRMKGHGHNSTEGDNA